MDDFEFWVSMHKGEDEIDRDRNKVIRKIFAGKINANFLIEMLYLVKKIIGPKDLEELFGMSLDIDQLIIGQTESPDYEICRNIVSIHRSNCAFDTDEQRWKKEQDDGYKKKLAQQVLDNLRLRWHAAVFFRRNQFILGDEFLFFPVPYKLFAISTVAIASIPPKSRYDMIYYNIFTKALGALILMESNTLENCYPIARGIIELYIKLLALKKNENALDESDYFLNMETRKNCCNKEFDDEFIRKWSNRKFPSNSSKNFFLHYGWVDLMKDYGEYCGPQPYSPSGLFAYLKATEKDPEAIKTLEKLHEKCHAYTHGNVGYVKYPLLNYFEISIILYLTIGSAYKIMCDELHASTDIEGFDICSSLREDADILIDQYNRKSVANFKRYYAKK